MVGSSSSHKKLIVVLSGRAGVGKSTAAELLVRKHGFLEVALATPLKQHVRNKYGLSHSDTDTQAGKAAPIPGMLVHAPTDQFGYLLHEALGFDTTPHTNWTPRKLLELEGALGRLMDPNHWVNKAVWLIEHTSYSRIVVSDLRFRDELTALRKLASGSAVQVHHILLVGPEASFGLETAVASETDLLGIIPNCAIFNPRQSTELLGDSISASLPDDMPEIRR